jgi:NAD(P)H-nitrite reductase large subunit
MSGIWSEAVRQGAVAAKNMCGESVPYREGLAARCVVNFFGLATMSVGRAAEEEGDSIVTSEDRKTYRRAILRDGAVKGVLIQGDISGAGFWQSLVRNGADVSRLKKRLWDISYADFYGVDEKGGYEWRMGA